MSENQAEEIQNQDGTPELTEDEIWAQAGATKTEEVTPEPTNNPTRRPTNIPSDEPTPGPTENPTRRPTPNPTDEPQTPDPTVV